MSQSPDIGQNSDGGNSDFQISSQSLIKRNCHDIDMRLGPVTKLDKGNKITSKKFHNDIMSENCDTTDTFPIYCQFGTIW